MKRLILIPLLLFCISAFGQWTKPQLYENINTNIRLKTYSPTRISAVLDSIVVSMGSGSSFTLTDGNGTTANGTAVDLGGVINGSLYSGTEIYPDTNNEQNFSIGKNGNAFNQIQFYSGDNGYQMFNNGAATSFTDFGYDGLGGTFSPYNFNVYFNNRLRLKSLSGIIFDFDQTGIKLDLGSDATGDTYYRNSSGYFTRLAAGTNGHVLTMGASVPGWAAPSGGGTWGSITGTLSSQTDLQTALDAKLLKAGDTYTTTTGNGLDITSSTVTSGNLVSITNTGTAAASDTKTALYVGSSGANGTSGQDTYAIRGINTNTGTTSVNYGGYFSATGGTTNYGLGIGGGNVVLNQSGNQSILKSGGSLTVGTSDFNSFGLAVNGVTRMLINGSSGIFTFITNTANSGSLTAYSYADATRTNQTASTETHFTHWTPNTTQFATGTQSLLRAYRMNPAIYSFVGSSVIDDAYTLWVASPIAGTNATITNNWSAGFDGNVNVASNLIIGTGTVTSANDRVKINGVDDTTGKIIVANNNSGSEKFSVQGDGVININGSAGTAGQVLVSNGTSAAAWAAGGIGGSTGATDNSILRADGTGGATLQNSGLFIDDSANLTIGTVSLSGNKTISAVNSTSDANLTLTSQGTVVVDVASSAESFQVMTTNDRVIINPAGFQLFGEKINASANATFLVSGAQGITGATTGQNLLLQAGSGYATGVTNGGHLYLMYGAKNSTGTDGNIGLLTSSVANWQSMERGVYLGNRLTAPTTGIANGVALFAEDSNSLSEFYVMPESGAKVNISGLFEPVTESGTSFTLNETHRNKIVLCSNSGVVTVTVGTGKAAGWNCMLVATHATGTITLSTSGTTINGTTSTTTQFETLSLVHYGSENYLSKLG